MASSPKKKQENKKLMDESKQGNHWKLFSFATRGRVFSRNYNVYRKMNVESAIKKL
jgi:hypothetical protein